ncbi:ribonuclease HIII [Vagococcus xieshaowenii]|uniref:Ribonuclease HIII n=1 Tax=Vagococcus xieshaowenii TaxID=2562451 RepID=A0AAJ5EFR1_9ENTE|nr:ribonuclease HIII [Vagococcus xieshaowenii]QCA29012.1 ribonuclease HIII [Vagococcus xieshaowenii]TFZ41013.1 ribonuclease HIII [Vagococcus xieshaowenii]
MSYSLKNQSASQMQAIKDYYQAFIQPKAPAHAQFVAKAPGVTITAYQSGTVLFQGNNAETEGARWYNGSATQKNSSINKKNSSGYLPKDFATWNVVGSDEVGNGSYLGPVVVCATYVKKEHMPLLKELGVKDSKMLKDSDIIRIAEDIKHVIPYQELIVTPSKYNDIQPTYNVNRMKVALHNQAIYLLLKKIAPEQPQGILIDQFTPEGNYRKYLSQEKNQVQDNLYFTTKGEQYHLSVAAASIICRASFLNELAKASKELGFTVPSGAGKASDLAAAKILKRGGLPLLRQYAKLHFANTEKAKKLIK